MPDQDGLRRVDLLQEDLQGVGQGDTAHGWERRRAAIAWHIPGDGAIAIPEELQLAAPRPRRAADSMQEYQWRQTGVAGGLVAEAAISGFRGREIRHAEPPCRRTCQC